MTETIIDSFSYPYVFNLQSTNSLRFVVEGPVKHGHLRRALRQLLLQLVPLEDCSHLMLLKSGEISSKFLLNSLVLELLVFCLVFELADIGLKFIYLFVAPIKSSTTDLDQCRGAGFSHLYDSSSSEFNEQRL